MILSFELTIRAWWAQHWAHKHALKPVNFEKLQEVVQNKQENTSQFLERLTKALLQYTNLDSESLEGKQLLMSYFFSPELPQHKS